MAVVTTVRRRSFLALLGSLVVPLTGCVGGPGDPITSLAVNQDDTAHTVTVRIARDGRTVIENTVTVEAEGVTELGTTPWRSGRYRVTVRVGSVEPRSTGREVRRTSGSRTQSDDGDPVIETAFRSDEWFNQLDVVIGADGSVEVNRARAA